MQKLKIYAQKTENGGLDYYTNLYHKDKETEKVKFQKLKIGFKREQEVTGHITVKESTLTFNKIKIPMELVDLETNKPVKVEVPYTAYRLYIWEYEKTAEDEEKDKEAIANGTNFIKEYVSPEEKQARFNKINQNNTSNTQQSNELVVEEDLEELELPF